ncbi:MAG: imidazole glycerol phosphate synthase subunit HisH [Candidatus Omnitrophota bacterium]|nr:imidazole glycerol phosphate synthase subunit HisH [Candidatus Omnitrophota bacterium]
MITIVDYGMGNLRSIAKALESLSASVRVTSDPMEVAQARKLIVPGVGAFGAAMGELQRCHLVEPITEAISRGTPYLGICLGLQLLFEDSEESPGIPGLGVLRGTVKRFPSHNSSLVTHHSSLKVPHMGWNQVTSVQHSASSAQNGCPLLRGIPAGSFFYFVHSYYGDPLDRSLVVLETDYGAQFPAMLQRQNLFATQFHPEKSQALGLRLLENFMKL